jgi:thiosulfate/3-mercaptopyruvate sulfurtransferase
MKRKRRGVLLFIALLVALLPGAAPAREMEPIVSVTWLAANLEKPNLVILDVRRVEEYLAGHIPKSLSAFYGAWAYKRAGLYTAIPDQQELDDLIGSAGIDFDSWVVVVGSMETPRESYKAGRVACTLQYAGIPNVALLDGGFDQWIQAKKPLETGLGRAKCKPFQGKYRTDLFADKEYVKSRLGKVVLLDVREREFFDGTRKMDCVPKAGRIPGAFNLPTSCAFNEDKTFRDKQALAVIAESAAGKDRTRDIVTYCDTGQCCPIWSYLMREILGYRNVRIYDGGMQEWMQDSVAPATK